MNGPFINIGGRLKPLVEAGGAGEVGEFARGSGTAPSAARKPASRVRRRQAIRRRRKRMRLLQEPLAVLQREQAVGGEQVGQFGEVGLDVRSCQSSLRQAASQ